MGYFQRFLTVSKQVTHPHFDSFVRKSQVIFAGTLTFTYPLLLVDPPPPQLSRTPHFDCSRDIGQNHGRIQVSHPTSRRWPGRVFCYRWYEARRARWNGRDGEKSVKFGVVSGISSLDCTSSRNLNMFSGLCRSHFVNCELYFPLFSVFVALVVGTSKLLSYDDLVDVGSQCHSTSIPSYPDTRLSHPTTHY